MRIDAVRVIVVHVFVLLILAALMLGVVGCDGGAGEAVAVDAAASDAAGTAATDAAATAAADAAAETADDVVTETAIEGSSDVLLGLGDGTVEAEPFISASGADDDAGGMVTGLSSTNSVDGTTVSELDDQATGQLRMISMTTRSIYEVERAYLDVQRKRLILNAVEKEGGVPTWGVFRLGDKVISDLQQTKTLKFIAGDGTPKILILKTVSG
jgi:hypothetical protein